MRGKNLLSTLAITGIAFLLVLGESTSTAGTADPGESGTGSSVKSAQGSENPGNGNNQSNAAVDQSNGGSLAEIIVTAQKRAESINDVPMSIEALTGDALLVHGITATSDLERIIPGFTAATTQLATPIYTLRGVGLFDSGLASSPTVSVYVDQVPLPFPIMTSGAALDVERVEVLEGPQGILFGQNSTGGAINYVAAKPTNTFETGGDITYARFGKIDAEGFASGPISDTLQARVAVRSIEGGAWQYSVTRPNDPLGETRQIMGRLLLNWQPIDRLQVAFNFNGNQNQSDSQAWQLQEIAPAVPAHALPALFDQPLTLGNARQADWNPANPMRLDDGFYQFAVRADYDVSDAIKLTDLTSYAHQTVGHFLDDDGTALPLSATTEFGDIKSFNEELRLASDTSQLHWVIGANYEYDNVSDTHHYVDTGTSASQPIPSIPAFSSYEGTAQQPIDTYAAFANVEYTVADHLSVHGGVRYTDSERHAHECLKDLDADNALGQLFTTLQEVFAGAGAKTPPVVPVALGDCIDLTPPPDLSPQLSGTDVKLSESNVSWRGGLDYKADGGTLLYANASRGYKAGVITNILGSSTSEYTPAKQERVDAYEAGLKAPLFDQHMHLDLAGFYYNYTDKQVRTREIDPIFGLLDVIVNVPKSKIWGFDGNIQAEPLSGLIFSVSGTYLHSQVTSAFNTVNQEGASGNFDGSPLPYTPKASVVGDVQYDWHLNGALKAFVGSSLTYRSSDNTSFRTAALPAPDYALPSWTVLDLRAGVAAKDNKWSVTAWARNVTNKYYWTFVYEVADTITRSAAMPLTYGVTIGVRMF